MKKYAPSEVDFWLDVDRYADYIDRPFGPDPRLSFSIDLIRLASIRKAVSNFVRILTRQSIPVLFNTKGTNRNINDKVIHISATINTKDDFDVAVGQALHEGSHVLLTDWGMVGDAWANLPPNLLKKSDTLGIRRASIEKFIHTMWNIIEDRYIDNYVFNRAPGYRGYYIALYNRFWNSPRIAYLLQSDVGRWPSLESYSFRISNLTNEHTDLTALPRLEDIADVIDIDNIHRLVTTKDRIKVAFQVTEIVLDCLEKEPPQSKSSGNSQNYADPEDFFGTRGESEGEIEEESKAESQEDSSEPEDAGTKMIKEITDIMSGRDEKPALFKDNDNAVSRISENEDKNLEAEFKDAVFNQRQFLKGQIPIDPVTPEQKELLDMIEQHGISLVNVGKGLLPGNPSAIRVECIVVEKMTRELILKGQDVFPLSGAMRMGEEIPPPPTEVAEAVRKGILLGTKLGRKLQLRQEQNPIKSVRKKSGKINRRQLHEAAFDAEDLFYKVKIEAHNEATLHISVDSSGSMSGEKWERTMMAVVAICKATSMIDNVHVTVSFRSTQSDSRRALPYIILAYDSRKDRFSKVKTLFPYLVPGGLTPEGLAFEAIMSLFEGITPDEEDRYFLNLSDGEPYYHIHLPDIGEHISYADEIGVSHTRAQINKIRRKGVKILSYFIESPSIGLHPLLKNSSNESYDEKLRENFRKMYGKQAQFINVESIIELAKTMNQLFLAKERS